MLRLFASALVALVLVTGTALAALGGPAPGVSIGGDGAIDASGTVRYVALPAARTTTIAAVRTSDGRVLRHRAISGVFGIPLAAFDGTAEGVSRDGRTLLLADAAASPKQTRFAVLRTANFRVAKTFSLPGRWAYDALSPDGRILYATEYLETGANPRYHVRSVSLTSGRPFGGPLVDKREPGEEMNGSPWARVRSANGAWAYTLYAKPNGTGFVHALDTAGRRAFCVDLPWRTSTQRLAAVRLSLANRGRTLELESPVGTRLAVVDTTTFEVTAFRKP